LSKQRLEAFTDGVIAIILTIMVLDLKIPAGTNVAALKTELPLLLAYALSFVNVGIFWNNHHHMLHVTERINGMVLWANLLLLFWLSLVLFIIRWMDQNALRSHAHSGLWSGFGFRRGLLRFSPAIHHCLQRA